MPLSAWFFFYPSNPSFQLVQVHGRRRTIGLPFSLCLLAAVLCVSGQDENSATGAEEPPPSGPQPVAQLSLQMTDGSGKQSSVLATVMPNEDAAAAAVRFCFEKGLTQPQNLVDITGYLKGALQGKEHEPENIEVLRTAGAYTKRAAESSKEENFIEAAAGSPQQPVDCVVSMLGVRHTATHSE
jgi:hypothetical protein